MPTSRQSLSSAVFLAAIIVIGAAPARAADGLNTSREKEEELLAVLRSEAPASEKAITCKHLAIHGSSAAVADLAPLLHDPQLASWATDCPGSDSWTGGGRSVAAGTRLAAGKATGRHDQFDWRPARCQRGRSVDRHVCRTRMRRSRRPPRLPWAASAMPQAARCTSGIVAPADSVAIRSAVAEGCVLCAERLVAAGKSRQRQRSMSRSGQPMYPEQRIIEATRGAILARRPSWDPAFA